MDQETELKDIYDNEILKNIIIQCIEQIIRNTENETRDLIYQDEKYNEGVI
jgi:hypothetical protein